MPELLRGEQTLEDFAFSYPPGNRVFGGSAHMDTVNYIYEELKETGYYDVYKQPQVHLWTKSEQSLAVNGSKVQAQAMTYSPSVETTADLVLVDNVGCTAEDYPADVKGSIALIKRGQCSFAKKSVLAEAAGAKAAIVYNNAEGMLSGTLGSAQSDLGPYAPIAGISQDSGQKLAKQLQNSAALSAHLMINQQMENRTTYNVIAQTKGGNPNNVITLGGHSDSVNAGPGINDDGSGIIGNFIVAKELTHFSLKNAVRFMFWTAEEYGLLGSKFYVNSLDAVELSKIRLYLNFDMIASPNYALKIYDGDGSAFNQTGPVGSAEIEHMFQEYYTSRNLPYRPTPFNGRSDYLAFIQNGIPAGGLFTGAEDIKTVEEAELFGGKPGVSYDPNYHGDGDDMSNISHEAFLINAKGIAYAVAKYAVSTDSLPPKQLASGLTPRDAHTDPHPAGSSCFHSLVTE